MLQAYGTYLENCPAFGHSTLSVTSAGTSFNPFIYLLYIGLALSIRNARLIPIYFKDI